jgi:hypothetical protein
LPDDLSTVVEMSTLPWDERSAAFRLCSASSESCIDCSHIKMGYLIRHDPRRFFEGYGLNHRRLTGATAQFWMKRNTLQAWEKSASSLFFASDRILHREPRWINRHRRLRDSLRRDLYSLCFAFSTSAARSPMMTQGAIVLPVVTRGMIEPSATRRLSIP